MPQEPKRRHSRQRKGKRRASISLLIPKGVICSNCNAINVPHTVCRKCGYYQGRQVIKIEEKQKTNEKSS
ncbi:MAG: 50S ribosomal protein L32 [Candidatus Levybacteria bacterium RIFCSPLOWO2_01_FULL_38_13]|nr:MAG: 50S ribosomal protein L32 [Candidatus Levybacteria bacterium RIFCSPHIGHO2_01_FULL_41_15]OGH35268.1 MAG: 50S ribosomal protein L32 [Candidatus Levybacteria bacterium RIFCSPLOWO2_01_FULL_38_13]